MFMYNYLVSRDRSDKRNPAKLRNDLILGHTRTTSVCLTRTEPIKVMWSRPRPDVTLPPAAKSSSPKFMPPCSYEAMVGSAAAVL